MLHFKVCLTEVYVKKSDFRKNYKEYTRHKLKADLSGEKRHQDSYHFHSGQTACQPLIINWTVTIP